jgi:signal transduction histidine kinase
VTAELRPRDQEEPVDVASLRSDSVERPFRFFFTDQALAVESRSITPEQWMQRSLLLNLLLTLTAMGLLVAAIVAALRTAARATRLSQMKTEFVSNVSHELRTPLSSIRVFGEFLRLGRVTDPRKIREYGESIETESRRLTQLVANILDFSGIESGQRSYRFEKVDAAEVVAETLRSFEVRLEREGFSLEMQTPPAPLPPIWADPLAVAQVVSNLVDNAIKYSGDARTIAVRLAEGDDFVSIAVADRGPGIDAEEHERIFEKFYRVVTGLQHEARGSGLGLSIVKHIMAAHRGRIDVRSEPGAGSTFTTRWPTRDV